MKSFIVAALLVVAVSGQTTMDLWKLQKEKTLLNKFDSPLMMKDLLMKKLGYPWEKTVYGDNVEYLQDELLNKPFYTIEELMMHPLFREYLNLPIFRQYWTSGSVEFKRFVTSKYFLQFWHLDSYKQFFVNPVYFYKYIYPIVTLFKTDITMPTTSIYDDELIKGDMIVNKNLFPVATGYERDLLKDKYFVPTIYNHELKFKDELLINELMTKIYSHLYNIPEELVKEHYLTGKIFNDKYTTTYPTETLKEELLKKMLFNKMIMGDKTIYGDKTYMPEEFLFREKMMKMNPWTTRMMYGYNKLPMYNKYETMDTLKKMNIFDDMTMNKDLKDELIKKEWIKNEMLKKELIKDKVLFNTIVGDKVNEMEKFGTFETVPKTIVDFATPMMKVKTFDKKIFPETMIKA